MSCWTSWVAVLLACATGCVRYESTFRTERTLLRMRPSVETIEGSAVVHASRVEVRGTTLHFRLDSQETCRRRKTPVYRKRVYEERFPAAANAGLRPGYSFALGAVALGAGAYTYGDAVRLSATDTSAEPLTPEDYENVGITFVAVGAALVAIGIVDSIRLRDREHHVLTEDGVPESRDVVCHRRPLANVEVVASVGGWSHRAMSDERGELTLAFEDAPEMVFYGSSLTIKLHNDVASAKVELDADQTAALLLALVNDSASTIARARDISAQAVCRDAVSTARKARVDVDTSNDEIEAAVENWRTAKRTCGTRWTDEFEADARAYDKEVAATANARATRRCSAAIVDAHQGLNPDERMFDGDSEPEEPDIAALRATLEAACEGASNASAALAAFDRRVLDRKRAAVARQRLFEAAKLADRYLSTNDAVGVWSTFQKHPGLGPLARRSEEVKRSFLRVATHWITALEHDHASLSARRQVCAGRHLVTTYVGAAAWSSLRVAAVKRSSATNGTKLARLLDGGACQ